jgi:hypothetical protein
MPPKIDGVSSRDAAIIRIGTSLGAGMLSTTERERFASLAAGAEVGVVKSTKEVNAGLREQVASMSDRQRAALEEALYDVGNAGIADANDDAETWDD